MFNVTARDQGHYKGPSGAFVTYCNISCFLLVNVKMPTVVGILTFMSGKNTILGLSEPEKN